MAYTTIDKPSDYFNTKLYTGNSSTNAITGVGFQPNWVWIKDRDDTSFHTLFDSIRGATKRIFTNSTNAEDTVSNSLTSFDSDGFTLGSHSGTNSNTNHVSWNWKAGTSFNNDASSTGIGTIDSAGSFNNDSGFSIVSYTGTGSAGTIKHGLNSTPNWILLKNRIDGSLYWYNYLTVLGNNTELYLNATDAAPSSTGAWNTTSPTSSVFSVGSHGGTNASGQATIAYCFAEKQGYSKFGSYTGNGNADGTYVHLGFKPAMVIVKLSSGSNNWNIHDNKRDTFNVVDRKLEPNVSDAESEDSPKDFLSNGFKCRGTGGNLNASGSTYIYMAFAEQPFVTSSGVPACAR